jgi:hypothetical protein
VSEKGSKKEGGSDERKKGRRKGRTQRTKTRRRKGKKKGRKKRRKKRRKKGHGMANNLVTLPLLRGMTVLLHQDMLRCDIKPCPFSEGPLDLVNSTYSREILIRGMGRSKSMFSSTSLSHI